jgi:tetratricopeptide (TPR) repeat protein
MVPPLAEHYFPRPETGPNLIGGLRPGQVVVLTHGEDTSSAAPAEQGGTGKTQLAVDFTHALWNSRAVEVIVWVSGGSREAVVTGYAQAATMVGAADQGDDAETAAAKFASWLAHTRQPWALIADDVADTRNLDGLWPGGPAGRVVITTRLPGMAMPADRNYVVVPVSGFSRREALDYLNARLTSFPDQRIEALDLAEDLDGLPLALGQAAAVMVSREQGCREYRAQLSGRYAHMSARSVDGVSTAALATWSLAAECAHELPPVGLAWPAIALAAMLDPDGIPGAVLTSPAACGYITGHPSTGTGPDQNAVRRAISNLARAGLVTIDPATPVRTVRMHRSVQAAVRAFIPRAELEQVVIAAADAVYETWPESHHGAPRMPMDQAMRDCVTALSALDSAPLWKPDAHPLLFRAGMSLEDSGLGTASITYWRSMLTTSTRLLGPAHPNAVLARDRLAVAFESAGQSGDAITVFAGALADRERNLGPEHPDTIAARGRLAHAYASAGRPEAITLWERTVADSVRQLGPGHPATLAARVSLVDVLAQTGQMKDAIRACQQLVTDTERLLGVGHPTTLAARTSLADAYAEAGQAKDALEQYRRVLALREANLGADASETIAARAGLASALRRAGKTKDAIAQYERVLADRLRVSGPDHLDTLAARANLAYAFRTCGQLREAIPVYEQTLADRERVQGGDHLDTRTARTNLAAAYQQAGRLGDAIPHYERALADSERMQGAGDIETLTDRCSFAAALFAAGRLMEVVTVLQRALADCEQYLGADHPMTRTVRDNLKAAMT